MSYKIQLFDDKTGSHAGELDVPEEIMAAADLLEDWMQNNWINTFKGLQLCSPIFGPFKQPQ